VLHGPSDPGNTFLRRSGLCVVSGLARQAPLGRWATDRRALPAVAFLVETCLKSRGLRVGTYRGARRCPQVASVLAPASAQLQPPGMEEVPVDCCTSSNRRAHPWRCGRSAHNRPHVWARSWPTLLFVPKRASLSKELRTQASSLGLARSFWLGASVPRFAWVR